MTKRKLRKKLKHEKQRSVQLLHKMVADADHRYVAVVDELTAAKSVQNDLLSIIDELWNRHTSDQLLDTVKEFLFPLGNDWYIRKQLGGLYVIEINGSRLDIDGEYRPAQQWPRYVTTFNNWHDALKIYNAVKGVK